MPRREIYEVLSLILADSNRIENSNVWRSLRWALWKESTCSGGYTGSAACPYMEMYLVNDIWQFLYVVIVKGGI